MYRVVFYALSSLGLGHITRCVAIANRMKKNYKDVEILMITSSEVSSPILAENGIMNYRVPTNHLRPMPMNPGMVNQWDRINAAFFESCMKSFRPHMVIVDTFPIGYCNELLYILPKIKVPKVLIHRQQPKHLTDQKNHSLQTEGFDYFLIPHEPEHYTLPSHITPSNPNTICYSGPVMLRERDEVLSKEEAFNRLGIVPGEKKNIGVCLGGGGFEGFNTLIPKIDEIASICPEYRFIFIPGSRLPNTISRPLQADTTSYNPLMDVMRAFDSAIHVGTYNTSHELIYLGIPTLGVPIENGNDDPTIRLHVMQDKNVLKVETSTEASAWKPQLDSIFSNYDSMQKACLEFIPENGANKAADFLMRIIK